MTAFSPRFVRSLGAQAYYNEIDPFAAQVLRELIREGVIAPGVVDERDIRDVRPDELAGFTQCHFFAGGGVWSYALRKAGWRDEWPIWTGSCPCQPFSQAGKGLGFDDERHLWPAFDWLIQQCGPVVVAGEQVADKGADVWLDLVQADLEGMGYAFGCVPLASAGFGAPNPRHRTFWMAYADSDGFDQAGNGAAATGANGSFGNGAIDWLANPESIGHEWRGPAWRRRIGFADSSNVIRLADALGSGCSGLGGGREAGATEYRDADRLGHAVCDGAGPIGGDSDSTQGEANGIDGRVSRASVTLGDAGTVDRMADALREGLAERSGPAIGRGIVRDEGAPVAASGLSGSVAERSTGDGVRDPGPTNGFWRDADWLYCRDPRGPRWRPVNRGTFPLAPGTPERVGTVRLSGNAINAEVAAGFAEAMIEVLSASDVAVRSAA